MDHIDKEILHQRELAERRRLWEAQREADAQEQARQEARGRMQAFLAAKRQGWLDHVGSLPPEEIQVQWQLEFLSERQAETDVERAFRLSQAEDVAAGG
jgi:hypothetical protein